MISNQDVTLYEDLKVIWHFPIKSLKKISHSVLPYAKLIKSERLGYEIKNTLQLIPTLEIQFYHPFSTFRLIYPLIGEFEVHQSQLIIAKLNQFENIPKFDKHQFTFDKGLRYSWFVILILGFILFFI